MRKPTITMIAGPNGSGKTTFFKCWSKNHPGIPFLNSDIIQEGFNGSDSLSLTKFNLDCEQAVFNTYTKNNDLWTDAQSKGYPMDICLENNCICKQRNEIHSYEASFITAFIRDEMLKNGKSFIFETVMSHKSKIHTLEQARNLGYYCNLLFIGLESPLLNVQRVKERVAKGGHDVPKEKIISRYERSMKLLPFAISKCDRYFIYDNSHDSKLVAKGNQDGIQIEYMPEWFKKNVYDHLTV